MKKRVISGIFFFLLCIVNINAQTDMFSLYIGTSEDVKNNNRRVMLGLDNTASEGTDSKDAVNIATTGYVFTSLIRSFDEDKNYVRDTRPYGDGLYVDFRLYLELSATNTYKISGESTNGNPLAKAVFVRLIDKENPNLFINLLEEDYLFNFTATSTTPVVFEDRFIARIYSCSLYKGDTTGNWHTADNWYGKVVPGNGVGRVDQHILIPATSTVTVTSSNPTIKTLYNSGNVIIETGASLTVENEVKLDSKEKYY